MALGRSLPAYTTGTITIANVAGDWVVSGSGTNFVAPDGVANYTLLAGDPLVCGSNFGIIRSVTSASALVLDFWSGSAVSSASAYKIYRHEGLPSQAVSALITSLLTLFSDANPQTALTVDTGAARFKFDDDGAGNMRLRVRSSTAVGGDGAYATAALIDLATGAVDWTRRPVVQSAASSVTVASTTEILLLTGTGVQTVTLPAATGSRRQLVIKDYQGNAGSYAKTILPNGSDAIDRHFTASNNGVGLFANYAAVTLRDVASANWILI